MKLKSRHILYQLCLQTDRTPDSSGLDFLQLLLVRDCSEFCNCTEECKLTSSEGEADFCHTGRALGSASGLLKVVRCEARLESYASLNPPKIN